jgi:hypothetical protein
LDYLLPGRTSTVVNDRVRRNTTVYMGSYYDRISPCRTRRHTTIYGEKKTVVYCLSTRRPYKIPVLPCIRSYSSPSGHGDIRS